MNSIAWIGIIVWGIIITLTGFGSVGPAPAGTMGATQAQDVVFLIAGGTVTCLIGVVGLLGFMGWIALPSNDKKLIRNVRQRTE